VDRRIKVAASASWAALMLVPGGGTWPVAALSHVGGGAMMLAHHWVVASVHAVLTTAITARNDVV